MKKRFFVSFVLATLFVLLAINDALAFAAPAATSPFYEVYDFVVNTMLGGAVGFLAGLGVIGLGITQAVQHKFGPAVTALGSGVAIVNAPAIVTAVGVLF